MKEDLNNGKYGLYVIKFDGWGCGGNEALIIAHSIQEAFEKFYKTYSKASPFVTKIKWLGWAGQDESDG